MLDAVNARLEEKERDLGDQPEEEFLSSFVSSGIEENLVVRENNKIMNTGGSKSETSTIEPPSKIPTNDPPAVENPESTLNESEAHAIPMQWYKRQFQPIMDALESNLFKKENQEN